MRKWSVDRNLNKIKLIVFHIKEHKLFYWSLETIFFFIHLDAASSILKLVFWDSSGNR